MTTPTDPTTPETPENGQSGVQEGLNAASGQREASGGENGREAGAEGIGIQPGQIYRSLGDPYPCSEPRRIKIVGTPGRTPGMYGFGKVDVVTITETGREIRRRAIETTQLHATPTTRDGKPRRTGYALEQPAHNAGPSVAEAAADDRRWWNAEKTGEQ
ncbi:hypothetical protein RKD49_002121 [Streptomyces glaucescens]